MVPESGSVAATVVTAVPFSAMFTVALAPPPLEVMTGASFTLATPMTKLALLLEPSALVASTVML
ncbi:hypothetical protein ACFOLG_15875 [Vogesella facilis]|uniref:Uncharacterized protein n=1 Tax=Vogesella facilis TaxID=1655232 RepID=A0ABV7RLY3_9NEIS